MGDEVSEANPTSAIASSPGQESCSEVLAEKFAAVRGMTDRLCAPLHSRRPDGAINAGGQPGQMASGAHDLVFRDLYSGFPIAGLPALRSAHFASCLILIKTSGIASFAHHPATFARPSLKEVQAYRHSVDEQMARWLASGGAEAGQLAALVELGLNHEQQHQELIVTDLKHALWTNPLRPAYINRPLGGDPDGAKCRLCSGGSSTGGLYETGHERRPVCLRQRAPAAQGVPGTLPHRFPPDHQWRIPGIHE